MDIYQKLITTFMVAAAVFGSAVMMAAIARNETIFWISFLLFCFSLLAMYSTMKEQDSEGDKEEKRIKQQQEEELLQQVNTLKDAINLPPIEFETLIGKLFEKMGYDVETTKVTGDGGIDLFVTKGDKREIVQCKRYSGNISVNTIREFFGVMIDNRITKGYIVTTGHFTLPSRQFAEGKGLQLIDGPELAEMLVSELSKSEQCDYDSARNSITIHKIKLNSHCEPRFLWGAAISYSNYAKTWFCLHNDKQVQESALYRSNV